MKKTMTELNLIMYIRENLIDQYLYSPKSRKTARIFSGAYICLTKRYPVICIMSIYE